MSSAKAPNLSLVDNRNLVSSLFKPLIPEGNCRLSFEFTETSKMYNHPKLVLHFKVMDFGEAFGVPLQRFYNIERLVGKAGRAGNFKATKGGDLLLEYLTLFPTARITRLDRLNMELFKNIVVIGKVKTVRCNNRQRQLPEPLQYSIIEKLVRTSNE